MTASHDALPFAAKVLTGLLRLLLMQVLSSRDAVPPVVLSAYRPLLAGMSRESFAEALLPALLRVVKRLPDVMLPLAEAVLDMITLDLSSHAGAIMKDLEQQLRHQKESVRWVPCDASLPNFTSIESCHYDMVSSYVINQCFCTGSALCAACVRRRARCGRRRLCRRCLQ